MLAGVQAAIHDGGTLVVALLLLAFHWFIQFADGNGNFNNGRYKVYQIKPNSVEQLKKLNRMEQFGIIDFWRPPPGVNSTADVMIDAQQNGMHFLRFLQKFQIEAKILVDDLSKLIDEKEIQPTARQKFAKFFNGTQQILRRDEPADSRFDGFGLRMGEYYDYAEMTAFMQRVQNAMSNRAMVRTIGWTIEGRPIQGIQFGNPNNRNRPIVWIDAGIHAREWTAVHTAIYFIFYIANQIRLGHDPRLLKCLEKVDILIFPCLNPDGYEYTRSEPRNPSVRMWRKNRSKERCVTDRVDQQRCCKGVDLNRNFDFKFAEGGTSFFPCSEIFHGANSFSEFETRAVRDAIMGSDLRGRVPALITMHAYSQLWIYPYSHRKHMYPPDVEELKSVARRAVIAIADKFGTNYQYGTGPETIYAYTGGSADWAKETAKIKYTYTIELRPSYWSWNGFILDRAQLIPTARETFDGLMVVLETVTREATENHAITNVALPTNSSGSKRSISPSFSRKMINSASTSNHHSLVDNAISLLESAKCEDIVPHCGIWLKNNPRLCIDSQGTMKRECRRTCSFCSFL